MTSFKTLLRAPIFAALISALIGVACGQVPFTYQGQLQENGVPANGVFDIEFRLWDAAIGGNQIGNEFENDELPVVNGQFTVELDFGYVFNGDERWLQIAVNGVVLSPRQEITAIPYASYAQSAGSIPGGLFGDSWSGSSAACGLSITNTSTATGAKALCGHASGDSGRTYGVRGESASTAGTGVYGHATSTSDIATGVGVYAKSDAGTGTGVVGTSPYIGVYGRGFFAGLFEGTVAITEHLYVAGEKGFVHEHPHDPTKELVYVCLEGGEAGTYIRGSAKLHNGEARVELPEHFALVTNAEGVTAILTPVGSYLQLYIAEQAADHLLVREASGKNGQFNYLVQGIRKGFEDHQVIRDRRARPEIPEPPSSSNAPTQAGEDGANE